VIPREFIFRFELDLLRVMTSCRTFECLLSVTFFAIFSIDLDEVSSFFSVSIPRFECLLRQQLLIVAECCVFCSKRVLFL
jgi:hypothetical protein